MTVTQNALGQSTNLPANPTTTTQTPLDNSTRVATTAYVDRKLKVFTSSNQIITAGGALTIAHGLGVAPNNIQIFMVCQTAEFNYSAGDVVVWGISAAPNNCGISLTVDATNLLIRFGSQANTLPLLNKSTGASANTTNSNWKVRFVASAMVS